MRIISEKPIRQFSEKHPESAIVMSQWIRAVKDSNWDDFTDVRKTFNHADIYKCCVIFDVGGNKYRIITKIKFDHKIVYIRFVLTHKQYDEKKWQSDCRE